jgi:hypothetical protein
LIGIQLPEKYKENFDVSSDVHFVGKFTKGPLFIPGVGTEEIWVG